MRESPADFHYSHILNRKPALIIGAPEVTKQCKRCGVDFTTRSRVSIRCPPCQAIVHKEKVAKQNAKLKERRRRQRAGRKKR